MESKHEYLPALKWHVCTGWYDFICSVSGLGAGFKKDILRIATFRGDERVADVGCGTGIMLQELSRAYPKMRLYGVDPDPALLRVAKRRLGSAMDRTTLEEGFAQHIPQPTNSFDAVFCTLTLHHLSDADKKTALQEMLRILKPGGRLFVVDFHRKKSGWPGVFIFENRSYIQSLLDGRLPVFLQEAGYTSISFFGLNRRFLSIGIGYKPAAGEGD